LSGGEQRHDVRVLQARRNGDLAPEAIDRETPAHFLREHLHHHATLERRVGCNEHAGHAAAAQFTLDGEGVAKRVLELVAEGHARPVLSFMSEW
jgi:hypothetical protein